MCVATLRETAKKKQPVPAFCFLKWRREPQQQTSDHIFSGTL